jgi:hypothetical protein
VVFIYLVLFLLGVLMAYLVLSLLAGRPLFGFGGSGNDAGSGGRNSSAGGFRSASGKNGKAPKTCPICGSLLLQGELIKSVVFQGGVRSGPITERMSHIFGCPFCYPANSRHPRICPVCGGTLSDDGYLVARMFDRPDRPRKHVHVLGCTNCRRGGK